MGPTRSRCVLVLAVVITCCVAGAEASGAREAAEFRTTTTATRTAAENEAVAQAEAAVLLRELSLPQGATESTTEPPEDDSLLATAIQRPGTPNLVDDHAWWIVPGPYAEVLAWIRAHPPAATSPSSHFAGLRGTGTPPNEAEAFSRRGALGLRGATLAVWAVQLPSGATALRADAQSVWEDPRLASEMIAPYIHLVRITVHSAIRRNQPKQPALTITKAAKTAAIVSLLNALPAEQPGARGCPLDAGVRVRLAFYPRRGVLPAALADVEVGGCGSVELTLDGAPQPTLEGGGVLIEQLDRVIGVKLQVLPPWLTRKTKTH